MRALVTVILGIHYHLPNGVDNSGFERLYNERIRAVMSALFQFPKIPAVLHFSGSLWYWIERNHSELFMLTENMVRRKQLELLTGGFYEPLMPLISYKDRLGHIEMLTTYLRKHFGKRTQGCLLPELAWDSSMPSVLKSCNVSYAFLDETYFFEAGIKGNDLHSPYISEDKGKLVTIFPISKTLSVGLEKDAHGTFDTLLRNAENGAEQIITIFPPCFNSVDAEHSTENSASYFLSELSAYENKINFSLPSKFIKNLPPPRKIYFPQKASKKCLLEYPETNYLYSKMTFTHALVDQLRGDKINKRAAYEELLKSQAYDLFYHTPQSGINRTAVRNAAYQALLDAEKITRGYKSFISSLMAFDFDFDGVNEYLFQSEDVNCFIKETGAEIFELDYIPRSWNYCCATGIKGIRGLFSDMIAPEDFSYKSIMNNDYSGVRLCADERYAITAIDRQRHRLSFELPSSNGNFSYIGIEKKYNLKNNEISVNYRITNKSDAEQNFIFVPELNMSFFNDDEKSLRVYSYNKYEAFSSHSEKMCAFPLEDDKGLIISGAAAVDFQDIHNEVIINLSSGGSAFDAWILSGRQHEGGDYYQSSRVLICKRLCLAAGSECELQLKLNFYH
ncbi:MAG: DUF1926 domain-containing protein [Spirochaetaceae bacterium]|jgi:hypothetical protein|nr:DUF1926 domain-containing protein [Spirochaetaceae bacterium]